MQGVYGEVIVDGPKGIATKRYLSPDDTQPFIRELYSLSLLRNTPHVIHLQDFHFLERKMVMDAGQQTLTQIIDCEHAQSEAWGFSVDAKRWLWQLVTGLAAVNSQGIWHRDLKPDNLVILPNNTLQIIDFNLAKIGTYESVESTNPVYSVWWRPPELLVANLLEITYHKYDGTAAEIYAVGSVFLCMLLGNQHGILQQVNEEKQLAEVLQMEGWQWGLLTPSFLDEYAADWRGRLLQKMALQPRVQSTLSQRILQRNKAIPTDALDLLEGLLHPDCHRRWRYETILQHPFLAAVRQVQPVLELPIVRVPELIKLKWYPPVVREVATTATQMKLSVRAQLFLFHLLRSFLGETKELVASEGRLIGYSCLFVADAVYSRNPTTLQELAGWAKMPDLELGVHRILAQLWTGPVAHPAFEALFSHWQIDEKHQDYPRLLQAYYALNASGLHASHQEAEIISMCVLMVQPQ